MLGVAVKTVLLRRSNRKVAMVKCCLPPVATDFMDHCVERGAPCHRDHMLKVNMDHCSTAVSA